MNLEILYQDEYFVAVNKPAGILVHRTNFAFEENLLIAERLLKEQIGQKVFPLHRIDRPTSGVLVFGLSSEAASLVQPLFPTDDVKKYYLTVVRGYMTENHGVIEHPLKKKLIGDLQEAKSEYWTLSQNEIPIASTSRYPTSRYSLLKVYPHTGRMHQIRRHLAHDRHYVIGDSTHGDNRQNHFFKDTFGMENLLLHAWWFEFVHPFTNEPIKIEAALPDYFSAICEKLGLNIPDSEMKS
ncbi:pseudouridine synthase [Aquiflexum sp. XJ19-11]|uniref:tRNA pseudouridine synthase C n=1 Tax=Aquiflexum gelatinilyticum TaxID=2961943 RepID=A0A9X2P936_9BACT|nr:pseudouridine synthase [Aquiflexum gelatinilyticum]MCR9015657.1 pseudouridine synthase [Aquiflexum gelatinilyticum]